MLQRERPDQNTCHGHHPHSCNSAERVFVHVRLLISLPVSDYGNPIGKEGRKVNVIVMVPQIANKMANVKHGDFSNCLSQIPEAVEVRFLTERHVPPLGITSL